MDVYSVPDEWQELVFELDTDGHRRAKWAHSNEPVLISSTADTAETNGGAYNLVVEQLVSDDEYEATLTTHANICDSWDEAEELASQLMQEINDGAHIVRLMETERRRDFIHFYCISDDEMPGEVTADQLIEATEEYPYDADIDGEVDYDDADIVVDVYTRPADEETEVTEDGDTLV